MSLLRRELFVITNEMKHNSSQEHKTVKNEHEMGFQHFLLNKYIILGAKLFLMRKTRILREICQRNTNKIKKQGN